MSDFNAPNLKIINAIDKPLASYTSRVLLIGDDQAELGKRLEYIASGKFSSDPIAEANFLRSCGYKLAQEGLILTSLIISRIGYMCKKLPPEEKKILHALGDFILEEIDPAFHNALNTCASYRHIN